MKQEDLARLIKSTIENSIPSRRLAALQEVSKAIPRKQVNLFNSMVDIYVAGLTDDSASVTVVLVHGIRTDGAWHQKIRAEFQSENSFNVIPLGYGFFSALGLWGPFRRRPISKIERELRDIRRLEPNTKLVLIAHSFGTYITAKLLASVTDIRFTRIILCGSIVSPTFRWDAHTPELDRASIVNDVGTKDPFPVLATCTTFGYGSTGRLGFQSARVRDRFFDYGHSDFFTSEHIRKYWKPFVLRGEIVHSEWDAQRPKTPSLVSFMSSGPWVIAFLLALLCWGALAF